jgi:molybdopterin synthase catalytic subunit
VKHVNAGGVVLFVGTVRELTGEKQTVHLEYEAYEELAYAQLQQLIDEAAKKWPLLGVAVHHRLGKLELGEAAVIVAVSTPHRQEAFEAAQYIMNEIKVKVPIWKKERWSDGTASWIHPGTSL